MKKNILSLAALLIASATFVACSSDDNIINEQPTKAQTYTMTINASKGDGATTRALSIDDSGAKNVLNATWATTENIYVKKGETWATGSLQPDADGTTATLKGELSGITIAKDDVLTLQFPKNGDISYVGQVGTLEDIAANFDYATATVTVADVSATGNIIPTEATTTFANQQAIVKFTLIDKADGLTPLSATQLVVNDGTNTYTVNPAPATSEIYVAIPGFTSKTVTLTATVGDDTYTFEKAGITFTNGQYYEITVKMTKYVPTPVATTVTWNFSEIGGSTDLSVPFTRDDIVLSCDGYGNLDFAGGSLYAHGNITFSNTLGKNFTSIVINSSWYVDISGFNNQEGKYTWTGNASSITFSEPDAEGITSIVFTLE